VCKWTILSLFISPVRRRLWRCVRAACPFYCNLNSYWHVLPRPFAIPLFSSMIFVSPFQRCFVITGPIFLHCWYIFTYFINDGGKIVTANQLQQHFYINICLRHFAHLAVDLSLTVSFTVYKRLFFIKK
jgi:hypothetical protein